MIDIQALREAAEKAESIELFERGSNYATSVDPATIIAILNVAEAAAEVFDDAEFMAAYCSQKIDGTKAYRSLRTALAELEKGT